MAVTCADIHIIQRCLGTRMSLSLVTIYVTRTVYNTAANLRHAFVWSFFISCSLMKLQQRGNTGYQRTSRVKHESSSNLNMPLNDTVSSISIDTLFLEN